MIQSIKEWWQDAGVVDRFVASLVTSFVIFLYGILCVISDGWMFAILILFILIYNFMNWFSKESPNAKGN
jgi:hypothetical protein